MHILHFGYNFKVINSFQDGMYIQYSISDDIVMIHNFASNIIINAQDM